MLNLVHMLLVVFLLTISMIAIHLDSSGGDTIFLIRRSGLLFLLGLPLMLLLFMTFPRIPGPLWDIGLAFGLPVKALMNRGDGEFGKMKNLQPGGIQRTGEDDENVLVAEFEGAVPFKSRLYWRGPVFWEYDGKNWNLPVGWNNRTELLKTSIKRKSVFDREIRFKKDPVRYTMRVMPNGGRWLYGLEVPAGGAPEAFISGEWQLLSIREIDDQEPKFEMSAFLEFSYGSRLTDKQRERGLSWPKEQNPRLEKLGKELSAKHDSAEEIVHAALALLSKERDNFVFDAAHVVEPGEHILDRYFFDEKRGGAEYLAGSMVMLMRAAGIPARLVSGFRGGTIIALTNFVIVKRSDAHTWLEVWQDDRGWIRVEPKDIILPPGKKEAHPEEEQAAEPESAVEVDEEAKDLPRDFNEPEKESKGATRPVSTPGKKKSWQLPDWASFLTGMQKWVINYDPDRQMDILKGVGLEESNWLDMLLGGAAGVAALLGFYLVIAWWRGRTMVDTVGGAWYRFCRRLKKFDLEKWSSECPRDYLGRISSEKPELSAAAEDIIGRYIEIRYGSRHSKEAEQLFDRQVRRFISMT